MDFVPVGNFNIGILAASGTGDTGFRVQMACPSRNEIPQELNRHARTGCFGIFRTRSPRLG